MDPLARIPTRWLLVGALIACLILWAAPGIAQTAPDALHGQLLFDDTPTQAGVPTLGTCTNCHATVQNRRNKIGGSDFADISYETALSHFGTAIASQPKMAQFQALDIDQVHDIAAYLADTPKVTATALAEGKLAFVASAVGASVVKNVSINHSVATTENLQIVSVSLGTGTPAFIRSSACNGVTRAPAGSCSFSITYVPTSTTAESRTLTINLKQGTASFARTLSLEGSIAGVAPPATTPPASADSGGGGALGIAWLGGLALATLALARRQRA